MTELHAPSDGALIGASVRRREDARLVRGAGTFASDVRFAGQVHAAVLRSPHARARIVQVDASAARSAPGVLAVVTFADIANLARPIPQLVPHRALLSRTPFPLAREVVRYVGEPVALVVAESRYLAEDALDLITVEYEPLPAAVDPEAALAADAPRVHDDLADNVAARFGQELGSVDAALAGADLVLRERLTIGRLSGQPLETRAVTALYEPGHPAGVLTVWSSTQSPHTARRVLAEQLDLPLHQVRVIAPDIGGGFGVKNRYYPEETLIPLMALRLRRPVSWVEDRRESFIASFHEREQVHEVTLGLAADGRIVALRDRFVHDQGAYAPFGVVVPYVTSVSVPGPYRVPAYAVECTMVYTNKTPVAPYRGAGKPQSTFVMERMLDLAARALGIDPAEIRRRNLLQPDEFPYETGLIDRDGTPVVYDSGSYPACLERALELVGYAEFPAESQRARGEGRRLGIGLACYIEMSGRGPFESALVRVEPSGKAVVYSGVSSQGQGHETILAQICAQHLGVPLEDVSVVTGDTTGTPLGMGTYASRVAVMAGNATAEAATAVRNQALLGAADLLEAGPDDLELVDGQIRVRGAPERSVPLGEVARRLSAPPPTFPFPEGLEPGLEALRYFKTSRPVYANGCYAVVLEVDERTGVVRILRHALVHDCGVVINPRIVDGQMHGGIAQGLGGALLEEVQYDADGQVLSASYQDYLLPTVAEVPPLRLDHFETPSPFNPLGVKGAGEGGTIPVAPAVNAAIEDALDHAVHLTRTPVHPSELRDALLAAQRAAQRAHPTA